MSGTQVRPEVGARAAAPRPGSRAVVLARLRDLALVPAIIAIAVVGYAVNPVFLNSDNLINILQTMSEIGLLVLAQTLVLIAGKMDLSLESTFGLAPGVAAWLIVPAGVTHGLGRCPAGRVCRSPSRSGW